MDINSCPICGNLPHRVSYMDYSFVVCRGKDEYSTHEVTTRPLHSQALTDKAWVDGDVSWDYGMSGVSAYQHFNLEGGVDSVKFGWSSYGSVSMSQAKDFRNRFTIVLEMAEHMLVVTTEE